MNLVEAELERRGGATVVRFGEAALRVPEAVVEARSALTDYAGRKLALGIRPEDVEDARLAPGRGDDERFAATVDIREDMGAEVYLHFSVPAPPVRSGDVEAALEHETVEALTAAAARRGTPFVARAGRATEAREGEPITLAVDTRRLYFFDLETGAAIDAPAPEPAELHQAALASR
jgi:multiple sugar transport system ATP-binding protein